MDQDRHKEKGDTKAPQEVEDRNQQKTGDRQTDAGEPRGGGSGRWGGGNQQSVDRGGAGNGQTGGGPGNVGNRQ